MSLAISESETGTGGENIILPPASQLEIKVEVGRFHRTSKKATVALISGNNRIAVGAINHELYSFNLVAGSEIENLNITQGGKIV